MKQLRLVDGRHQLRPIEDPWEACTPEGLDYEQMRRMAGQSMFERLEWAVTLTNLARRGRERAEAMRKASEPPESS